MRVATTVVLFAALAAPAAAQPARPWSPADAVAAAWADAQAQPAGLRAATRWLDVGHLDPMHRDMLSFALAGLCNSLSREPDIVRPVPVADGRLLRVVLSDYQWPADVWERLSDPRYVATVETVATWPGGVWARDGRTYPAGSFTYYRRQQAAAPWLGADATALAAATGSRVPVVRGDWFVRQAAAQEDRDPGYYDFLGGMRNERSFRELVRFDEKLAARLEQRRVVVFSGIAQQPRRLERLPSVLGALWRTADSATATDRRNPLRVLNDDHQHDASEQFAPLPNGMPAWFLANGKGERQDKAPDSVIQSDWTGGRDKRLHICISCFRCHFSQAGENGVKAIDAAPIKELSSPDYDVLRTLRRQYTRDLEPLVEQDRRSYAAAVKAASGLESHQFSQALAASYRAYDEARVDLAWAARDLGVSEQRLADALTRATDPVLSVVRNGGAVPVSLWEEVYGTAQEMLRK